MSDKKRIACFFTAGYTELNALKVFMRKINADCEYIQLCPTRARRSAADIRDRNTERHTNSIAQNGYTGNKLIEYIIEFVGKEKFSREKYDAILIEDDKDNRFLNIQEDGTGKADCDSWKKYREAVISEINKLQPDIPVVFFLAAPEAEVWFLADWENGFGSAFKNELTSDQNSFFSTRFRQYVNEHILTSTYQNYIEEYGYFERTYRKLSEEIQSALQKGDFWGTNQTAIEYPPISYSKRKQGADMMEKIDPNIVQSKCSLFFQDGFYLLQNI